jgi:hypothetical protein
MSRDQLAYNSDNQPAFARGPIIKPQNSARATRRVMSIKAVFFKQNSTLTF